MTRPSLNSNEESRRPADTPSTDARAAPSTAAGEASMTAERTPEARDGARQDPGHARRRRTLRSLRRRRNAKRFESTGGGS